jgi:CO dehydrogenase/acetyl-CoA synthase beta subunit
LKNTEEDEEEEEEEEDEEAVSKSKPQVAAKTPTAPTASKGGIMSALRNGIVKHISA